MSARSNAAIERGIANTEREHRLAVPTPRSRSRAGAGARAFALAAPQPVGLALELVQPVALGPRGLVAACARDRDRSGVGAVVAAVEPRVGLARGIGGGGAAIGIARVVSECFPHCCFCYCVLVAVLVVCNCNYSCTNCVVFVL